MKNEQNEKKNRDLGHAPLRQLGGFHENVLYPFKKKYHFQIVESK